VLRVLRVAEARFVAPVTVSVVVLILTSVVWPVTVSVLSVPLATPGVPVFELTTIEVYTGVWGYLVAMTLHLVPIPRNVMNPKGLFIM
jgi:hypothetical protein